MQTSKISLIGDLHFGAKGDNENYLKYQLDCLDWFIDNHLIPNNINYIIQVGDFFNSRKLVNMKTYHIVRERFLNKLQENNIEMYVISGNHDLYYTNSSEITTLSIIEEMKNIHVIKKPTVIQLSDKGTKIGLIPWLSNDEEIKEFNEFISVENPYIVCGHFEFAGFQAVKGFIKESGLNPNIVKNYPVVYSGHFHMRQNDGNIFYLGTPYEKDWGDYGIKKYFYLLDLNTKKLEPILNDKKLHYIIDYDKIDDYKDIDFTNKKVKIVTNDTVSKKFQEWLMNFEGTVDSENFSIVDNSDAEEEVEAINVENKGLLDIIKEHLKKKGIFSNKLFGIFKILYKRKNEI